MNDSDWFFIEDLIQDINLVKNKLVSEVLKNSIIERLNEQCETEEAIRALKEIT